MLFIDVQNRTRQNANAIEDLHLPRKLNEPWCQVLVVRTDNCQCSAICLGEGMK